MLLELACQGHLQPRRAAAVLILGRRVVARRPGLGGDASRRHVGEDAVAARNFPEEWSSVRSASMATDPAAATTERVLWTRGLGQA